MGYMGFGMQRWIYTQRPRKAFSKLSAQGMDVGQHKHLPTGQANASLAARKKVDAYFAKADRDSKRALVVGAIVLVLLAALAFIIF